MVCLELKDVLGEFKYQFNETCGNSDNSKRIHQGTLNPRLQWQIPYRGSIVRSRYVEEDAYRNRNNSDQSRLLSQCPVQDKVTMAMETPMNKKKTDINAGTS